MLSLSAGRKGNDDGGREFLQKFSAYLKSPRQKGHTRDECHDRQPYKTLRRPSRSIDDDGRMGLASLNHCALVHHHAARKS